MKWRRAGSRALLIPGIWIAIQGSRPVSYWFGAEGGESIEGNPINLLIFAILIAAAVTVLFRRQLNWGELIRRNKAVFFIYLFLALSSFWSELPFVSLKRIIKDFGCVAVGLVILAELDPITAIKTIFVRVSYILFPLSVVLIKYFPSIGRQSARSGENMFTGITTQKNSLGETVFVFGLIILWDLIETWREGYPPHKKEKTRTLAGLLLIGSWLLYTCDSQTSVLCLLLGGAVFWVAGCLSKMKHGKQLLVAGLAIFLCFVTLDKTIGLSDMIVRSMGRNPTLTGRTDIWRVVMEQKTDPLIGEGFYIFWDTAKGEAVGNQLMRINSTHNGYLEVYIDAGLIGAILLGLLLLTAGVKVSSRLFSGSPLGRIGLAFWITAIVYNLSESSFFRLDPLWFVFLLLVLDYPSRLVEAVAPKQLVQDWEYPRMAVNARNVVIRPGHGYC